MGDYLVSKRNTGQYSGLLHLQLGLAPFFLHSFSGHDEQTLSIPY